MDGLFDRASDEAAIKRGDRYRWMGGVNITVTRVARDGSWVDISHEDGGSRWTKRIAFMVCAGTCRATVGASTRRLAV